MKSRRKTERVRENNRILVESKRLMKIDLKDHFDLKEKSTAIYHQTMICTLEVSITRENILLDDNKEKKVRLKLDVKGLIEKVKKYDKETAQGISNMIKMNNYVDLVYFYITIYLLTIIYV